MKQPVISVIMPVFNGALYLDESIYSILTQTMGNFEFIIIDDYSTDSSVNIIRSFKDKRINLYKCNNNYGNYFARNIGIKMAKGKYISVMDCDDIALPNKLQTQYRYMEKNSNIGMCGSFVRLMGTETILKKPISHEQIKVTLLKDNCLTHPTLLVRNSINIRKHLHYNTMYYYSSDYDLMTRAANFTTLSNIPEVLLEYRLHTKQISTLFRLKQKEYANQIKLAQLRNLHITPDNHQKELHLQLMNQDNIEDFNRFKELQQWANFLLIRNNKTQYYNPLHLTLLLKNLLSHSLKNYQVSSLNRNKLQSYTMGSMNSDKKLSSSFPKSKYSF